MFFFDIILRVFQDDRAKLHIAWFVNPVYIAESRRYGEAIAHLAEVLVRIIHLLRLRIEQGVVHIGIIHAVFLAAGHAEFDFQGHAEFIHALKVAHAGFDILFQRFFRQVEHV